MTNKKQEMYAKERREAKEYLRAGPKEYIDDITMAMAKTAERANDAEMIALFASMPTNVKQMVFMHAAVRIAKLMEEIKVEAESN